MKKTVYIIYSSRKGGHTFPASALASYLKQNYSNLLNIKVLNFLEHSQLASQMDAIGRYGDLKLRKLWKASYSQLEQEESSFTKIYKNLIPLFFANPLMKNSIGNADLIISFQPEMNALLGSLANCPIHTLIVDYSAHGLWIHEKINKYYVASPEVADKVAKFNVPKNRIKITGIPLRPSFEKTMGKSIPDQRALLGIERDKPTILLLGGLLGTMVDYYTVIKSMQVVDTPYQLLVICGKNESARKKCESIAGGATSARGATSYLYGAVYNMDEFMWASDLIISKPGSVTIGEAISLGKPMILIEPKAGSQQEIIFSKLICEKGAGISTRDSNKVGILVKELLTNREKLKSMGKCAENLGCFNRKANESIANDILDKLHLQ